MTQDEFNLARRQHTSDELRTALECERIPTYMHGGLIAYITEGRPTGDFLAAILRNDFFTACRHADANNQQAIWDYSRFLFEYAPTGCYGTPAKVDEWLAAGRATHAGV